jgi:peptide deformylase
MLKLVHSTDPVLKENTTEWVFDHPDALADAEFLEDAMIQTMQASNGIGLAANQVGLTRRMFVMKPSTAGPIGVFNPKVVAVSDDLQVGQEGCLSFPDLWLNVSRPQEVVAEYIDRKGKSCIIKLTGLDARVFLHELDHLNGVCFIEKVSALKLSMARKKQQKRKK